MLVGRVGHRQDGLFCTYLFGYIVSILYGTLLVVFTDNFLLASSMPN